MKTPAQFDLLQTEITDGAMLIEASAGTGKTFTIAHLVLRLLLERPDLTIDRILVTTFTELATAELRGRTRELLRNALAVFQANTSSDELLNALLKAHPDHEAAAARLDAALTHFDEAPIYTIHGFCQRVLAERAFESGTLFDAELVTNQRELLHEIVHDFWRSNFYGGTRFAALLALRGKISPEKLFEDIDELTRNPALTVLPQKFRPCREIAAEIDSTVTDLRRHWQKEGESIRKLFADGSWALHSHGKPEKMLPLLDNLEQCLAPDCGSVAQLACLESFAARMIATRVRKKADRPQKRVFDACEQLLDLGAELCIALRAEFFAYARAQLCERKLTRNIFSYEDLLTRLDDALRGPGGAELAESIRGRYAAALIDEFQDTDPIQYSIFAQIYRGSRAPVAFIGDPKQAIYAFRGADVFTYMNAARETDRRFTLRTNWRSESRLVNAVNTIFDRPQPFLLDDILFTRAAPSPRADESPLRIGDRTEPPFHLWMANEDADLPQHVASEIVRLLTSGVTIGADALEARHIAVLTSTNGQAADMQNALRLRGVPSVLYSSANIFRSREAEELRQVLEAVVQPSYEKVVRAALATDALGRTGNDLDELSRDDSRWETELLRFQKHHEIWRERGFIQMLRHLAAEHGVRRRLLSYPDGERRLTNFLHLAELLHSACVEQRLGMNGVLKWLGQQMQGKAFAEREEHELRLESDEKAVRIITVHKSKGLEFDVVFCPFVWWTGKARDAFHDPDANHRLTLDLENSDAHEQQREDEAMAESLRQFYVAVTRAKQRCTMVWRRSPKADNSAPAYLLAGGEVLTLDASDDIAVADLPEANATSFRGATVDAVTLQAREFKSDIDRSWGVASFSKLISGREADPLDEGLPVERGPDPGDTVPLQGIHAFPRGMRAGTCLHEIFEQVEFGSLANAEEIVQRKLRSYAIEGFDEAVLENVRSVAALPLADFKLAQTQPTSRIAELEFSFSINDFTTAKLAQVLELDRLQFQQISGFMNGFIDLIVEHDDRFYFIDWKSNWLGPNRGAYHPAAVAAEMQRHFYTLQLCLYTVALHRYLRVRKSGYDYNRHFGGAFYIFLRGIDPAEPKNGVHHQRLDRALVEKLSAIFE